MREHEGRVAIVTGGSQGIGRGVAEELSRQGSAVVVHGQSRDLAEQTAADITASGGRAIAVWGAIDDPATSESAVSAALAQFGAIDTLVTSAGIQRYGDVVSTSLEDWNEVFAVNVTGVYLAAKAALPHIRKSPAGSVAIISSVQGVATQSQVAAYTTSKGALNALARAMAVDEAAFGVRVNSILPGSVDTPMLRTSADLWSDGTAEGIESILGEWGRMHALGRIAQPSELGAVVSFITSPRASFVTGGEIRVDGGLLAQLAAALPEKP
jgi:NAD(P)-dependent dehydrogenase (short-subunit alcohol dehydrogenase family)